MVVKVHLAGYEEFSKFFDKFEASGKLVHVYFTGSKLPSGESWCPDCVKAWPIVEKQISQLPEDSHFITVEVGDRETWKDPNCGFRKDARTKLLVVPTLIRWNKPQRLNGEQLEKPELVEMIFNDDD
ncbi:thioredoxin domain-containing protein 17-like [Sitophilus oryzae]|uniref:Thioredoxin domain-containing protein 17 n=1 Tax=Sitophilus oryzae TaxID=7048 RepID=A0A6J2Y4I4_SITOR|nr:thioredoxin domain-containing protein 17-like [Sitophilus oryzae]